MNLRARLSRRQFVNRTLGTSGMLALAATRSRPAAREVRPVDSGALAKLRAQLKGRLVVPGDADYDTARRVYFWNPDTEKRPQLVVRCAHTDDVRHAVGFAVDHALEVAVRGGGHSPMGWGTSDGLVIDLAGLNRVTIDPVTRTARVDAGVLSGDVMRQAGRYGLAPVGGQCPDVGAAGVTLGGGLGWLSGLHGAACDNLLAAQVVTAAGRILSVDAERQPDLLWGLRGAGANFGITTSFDCRLHPVGLVTAGAIHYPVREARSVLRFFRDLMAAAPDAFQATLNLTPGERGVFVLLCHAGESADADRLLRSLRSLATPSRDTVRRQQFADLAGVPPTGTPNVDFRCVATAYRPELTDQVMDMTLDRLAEAPAPTVIGISHYMHGELCRATPDSTAFPLRQAGGVHIRIGADWNDPGAAERLMPWASQASRRLRSSSGERIYANYQSHAGKGSAEAVYGSNHARLVALKNTYDPTNVFRRNSNVEPTPA